MIGVVIFLATGNTPVLIIMLILSFIAKILNYIGDEFIDNKKKEFALNIE